MSKKVIIESKSVETSFKEHLATPEENRRILFSGPFGAGKTYFINDYFLNNPQYIKVCLFPVDYPVASNEDILENIKFDILNYLLDEYHEDLNLQPEDFSALLLVQMYVLHKMDYFSLGKKVLNWIVPGTAEVADTIEGAKVTLENYEQYKSALTESEQERVVQYLASARSRKGSIRERDGVTELIRSFLLRLKDKYNGFNTMLIIDDLDRLDPDHVFRLFNIFTAHFDSLEESNKFNFDQVMLVCDIDTLRHMFHHRYGPLANFNGYIDKFYSTRPFVFNNRQFLIERIEDLIAPKMKLTEDGPLSQQAAAILSTYGKRSDFFEAFKDLLSRMIELGQLKIRNFDRFGQYVLPNTKFTVKRGQEYQSNSYTFLVFIHFLRQFFVGLQELQTALQACCSSFSAEYTLDNNLFFKDDGLDELLISMTLPFIIDDRIVFKRRKTDFKEQPYPFDNEFGQQILIYYSIDERNDYWNAGLHYLGCKHHQDDATFIQRPNPYIFILRAFAICLNKNFIVR